MKLSIIIHLAAYSVLHWRHLLESLETDAPSEVHLFHAPTLKLPEYPSHWKVEPFSENNPMVSWKQGLESSTGDCIAFMQNVVNVHPEHFNLCIDALAPGEMDAVFTQAEFVDKSFFPVEQYLPSIQVSDMPGFLLQSRLQWPVETFVFRKASLEELPFTSIPEGASPEWFHLLPWLKENQVEAIPAPTIEAAFQEFWKTRSEGFLSTLLENHSAAELLPAYARGKKLTPADANEQAQTFIMQALRNQQALGLLQKQSKANPLPNTTLVLSTPTTETPVFKQLFHRTHTVRAVVEDHESPIGSPMSVYTQKEGIPEVRLFGFSTPESYGYDYESSALGKHIARLVVEFRPERIHALGIKPFGSELLTTFAKSNYPIYLSAIGEALTEIREALKNPEDFEENYPHETLKREHLFREQNKNIEAFVENHLAGLLSHQPEIHKKLQEQGYKNPHLIQNIKALKDLYQKPVLLPAPDYPEAFKAVYEQTTGQTLSQRAREDLTLINKQSRVLCVGEEATQLVSILSQQKVWCQGVVFDEAIAQQAQQASLPIHHGKIHSFSGYVHYFDTVHVSYTLETLNTEELRHFLSALTIALKKGGQLILRGFQAAAHEQLFINPAHRRPYGLELVKSLLEYIGFEITNEEKFDGPIPDYRLEARLKIEALPQSALPIASPEVSNYWKESLPQLSLEEDDRVLLMGTQIFKPWLIYRVQCQYLLGITLNFAEMGKPTKKPEQYHFRHTRDPLKTLRQIKTRFNKIVVQNVLENYSRSDMIAFLRVCHEKLEPSGTLHIESLSNSEMMWQELLTLRPVNNHRVEALSKITGFSFKQITGGASHDVYVLTRQEQAQPEKSPERTPLITVTEEVKQQQHKLWAQFAGKNAVEVFDLKSLKKHTGIHAQFSLDFCPPGQIQHACNTLIAGLEPGGFLMITSSSKSTSEDLEQNVSKDLLSYILQSNGMRQVGIDTFEDCWIWFGVKSIQHTSATKEKTSSFSLFWKGDVLNYHSLATVNRSLLETLLTHKPDTHLSIENYSTPAFVPAVDTPYYPLFQKMQKPILASPDFEIRHHWPPQFEVPESTAHWVMIQPWEFGSVPEHWIYNMNKFVDEVWVPSEFVRKSYIDSGLLENKVAVIPNGVDVDLYHPDMPPLILETSKKFKFLYVGGIVMRKGLDILLSSYFKTFTAADDVCLVIKEFGSGVVYDGIPFEDMLKELSTKHDNPPEVLRLNTDLSPEQMPALYNACDALVHAYRGEGFAMPIAEAMACEKPVIVTDFGACLDFCNADNSFLIPAEKEFFEQKKIDSLATVDYPYWAQPDAEALQALLRHVYENPENIKSVAQNARKTICEGFTWEHATLKLEKQLEALKQKPVFRFYREHNLTEALKVGFEAIETEQYSTAVEAFDTALKIDPYQPSVLYNLGIAHLMLKNYDKAVQALTRSMREGTITGDLCYAMGTALRHLGDQSTSQQFFARAQKLNPELFSLV